MNMNDALMEDKPNVQSAVQDKQAGYPVTVSQYGVASPLDIEQLPLPINPLKCTKDKAQSRPGNDKVDHDKTKQDDRTKALSNRPWTGKSTEDVMNETVIKTGLVDKPITSNLNEMNIGRPLIWPNLKSKEGISTLSAVFVQAMEKRQSSGRYNTPSTFKPPPRVTLTDTKRESWLRDLSDPSVPLRKLSRTIPHGIRGKTLLEQCIDKNIRVDRAVWLIQCVGANEIRAFRRKGSATGVSSSGESRWVQEWTSCVEQMIYAVIQDHQNINYSIRLKYILAISSKLFYLRLLDRDRFLDWILLTLHTLSTTKQSTTALIIIVKMFWKPLISIQQRSRRLVESLLPILKDCTGSASIVAYADDIFQLLKRLLSHRPTCFTSLKCWHELYPVLMNYSVRRDDVEIITILKSIHQRYTLVNSSPEEARRLSRSPRCILFERLDNLDGSADLTGVLHDIDKLPLDNSQIICVLYDWAVSSYRNGCSRRYLVINLMHKLAIPKEIFEETILQLLAKHYSNSTESRSSPDMLIYEFVRSDMFNYSRYLSWLISSGYLARIDDSERFSLIFTIPNEVLNPATAGLCRSIAGRINPSRHLDMSSTFLEEFTASLLDNCEDLMVETDYTVIFNRSELSARLACINYALTRIRGDVQSSKPNLSTHSFCILRSCIEGTTDLRLLIDLFDLFDAAASLEHLSAFIDTIRAHRRSFDAIGVLQSLTERAIIAYNKIRCGFQFERQLLRSLLMLCQCQTSFTDFINALEGEILVNDQSMQAFCSPASDSAINIESQSTDEHNTVDQILSSGNVMDEGMFHQIFQRILREIESIGSCELNHIGTAGRWFTKLRKFDESLFDTHTTTTFDQLLESGDQSAVSNFLVALSIHEALETGRMVEILNLSFDNLSEGPAPTKSRAAGMLLSIWLCDDGVDHHYQSEIYRFRLARYTIQTDHSTWILKLFQYCMTDQTNVNDIVTSDNYISWLRNAYLVNRPNFSKSIDECSPHSLSLVGAMAGFNGTTNRTTTKELLYDIIMQEDELRIPFVQLYLDTITKLDRSDKLTQALFEGFSSSINSDSRLWLQLLQHVPVKVSGLLYHEVCENIIKSVEEWIESDKEIESTHDITRLLQVAACTAVSDIERSSQLINLIYNLLKRILTEFTSVTVGRALEDVTTRYGTSYPL